MRMGWKIVDRGVLIQTSLRQAMGSSLAGLGVQFYTDLHPFESVEVNGLKRMPPCLILHQWSIPCNGLLAEAWTVR